MSNRSKSDAGEYEFTRAAADTLRDTERACGVLIHTDLRLTAQKGVLALVMIAVDGASEEGVSYVTKYTDTWPNSRASSFAAFYFQCSYKLARMVEAWYQARPATGEGKRP